jgi:hypothetical protein
MVTYRLESAFCEDGDGGNAPSWGLWVDKVLMVLAVTLRIAPHLGHERFQRAWHGYPTKAG